MKTFSRRWFLAMYCLFSNPCSKESLVLDSGFLIDLRRFILLKVCGGEYEWVTLWVKVGPLRDTSSYSYLIREGLSAYCGCI